MEVYQGMTPKKPVLLIPVENQVRELDAKLLLACVAAQRGLPSIIGPKRELESRIASFPRSIFLSKSLRIGKRKFFPIARQLGHEIVAWDEEALVHLPAETYFSRRLSPVGMEHVSHLFAWGEDNAALWRQYPQLPAGMPIHVTGNPRGDLLRPEMQAFYEKDAEQIRNTYGQFILINTNFNHVNAFYPSQNLFQPPKTPGEEARFGQAARGMTREYAQGFQDHKQAIFADFKQLIPVLDASFPDYTIIVRPHPTENNEIYHSIAARCQRVKVTNEGNIVPWLMATRALIHNGCTTGVEAYVMRIPAISFRATVNDDYDDGFYRLPNRLSHQSFDFEQLREMLQGILSGQLNTVGDDETKALLDRHLAAQNGPLACERIVDVLIKIADDFCRSPGPTLRHRVEGRLKATHRRLRQSYRSYLPDSPKSRKFQRHRYPVIAPEEFGARLTRFRQILGGDEKLHLEQVSHKLFKISV
jgi:surface carbohydrate biosynthesis protein